MKFRKFSALLTLYLVMICFAGCNCPNNSTKPSNPFAQNRQTVPPPATFSSQEAYLGQTPGAYIPQTPATTFPPSGPVSSPPPTTSPSDESSSAPVNGSSEKATLFTTTGKESGWTAVEVAATNQTAFQAMETKANAASAIGTGNPADTSESLIVGTSHVVTTVTDESSPETVPPLYSGKYAE